MQIMTPEEKRIRHNEAAAKFRQQHPDLVLKSKRKYRILNRERIREQDRMRRKRFQSRWPRRHKEQAKLYRLNPKNGDAIKARRALNKAIESKKITRPNFCDYCRCYCTPQGHHYAGYKPEHYLDVIWLCEFCHKAIHFPNH
jgi:hypothetical protein